MKRCAALALVVLVGCGDPAEEARLRALVAARDQELTECRAEADGLRSEAVELREAAVAALMLPPPRSTPDEPAPSGPPVLVPVSSRVRENIIGTPELQITVRNETARAIDGFRFSAVCFDNFGDVQRHRIHHDDRPFRGSSDDTVRGRAERSLGWWTLYDFPLCTRARVTITEVHFVDGERWTGAAVQAEGEPN